MAGSERGFGADVDETRSGRDQFVRSLARDLPESRGDLLSGSHNSHIATLVERTTRFTKLVKIEGKDTASVVAGLSKQVRALPVDLLFRAQRSSTRAPSLTRSPGCTTTVAPGAMPEAISTSVSPRCPRPTDVSRARPSSTRKSAQPSP